MAQPVEVLQLLLAVAADLALLRKVLDQLLDPGPELIREVRRRRRDQRVDVVPGRLRHRAKPTTGADSCGYRRPMRKPAADLLLLLTVSLWALNFTAGKYILEHGFSPL